MSTEFIWLLLCIYSSLLLRTTNVHSGAKWGSSCDFHRMPECEHGRKTHHQNTILANTLLRPVSNLLFTTIRNKTSNMMGTIEKRVSFHEIEILEFPTILGDNPAVSSGAPIALGYDLVGRTTVAVDVYEQHRGKRKHRKKLVLPVDARARL